MLKKGNIYLLILMKKISSIDLFAGVGGMRISLSKALKKMGFEDDCKLYSEINSYSQQTYQENFPSSIALFATALDTASRTNSACIV